MNTLSKASIVLLVIFLAGFGLLFWKVKVGGHGSDSLTKLTKADMQTIFKDAPPQALKRLADDPELKKKQIEEIKQFLAVAEAARSTGFANEPEIKQDLDEIRMTIMAVSYDKEKNKEKENLPPFSSITKEQVDAFFQKDDNAGKFDALVKEQIEKAKKDGRLPEDFEPPAEQLDQAKEQYAKVRISAEEAKANWSGLSEEFKHKTELQIKLQQAQYLDQKYTADVIAKKVKATDEEINNYLKDHPEEAKAIEEKKAKANEILQKAKAPGADFAKLAQEFSEDPGSKKDGGLYKDVTKGGMVPEFEQAALALEPGQISDLVETKYGYHIIKLERKGVTKDKDGKESDTYDARHILISTMSAPKPDPTNPMGAQPQPLKEKIKLEIEKEKQKKILDEIEARHPIEIEDFDIVVPPMPEGQNAPGMSPNGNQPQLDQKQMEELQKKIKEMQEKQKNAPKTESKPEPKKDDKK